MAGSQQLKTSKNICILATRNSISADDYRQLVNYFEGASFTLIAPFFKGEKPKKLDIWTDGARSGFLKVLTISRRMSWSSFDLVINWEQGGLENALCFMLLPKPKILNKAQIMTEIT